MLGAAPALQTGVMKPKQPARKCGSPNAARVINRNQLRVCGAYAREEVEWGGRPASEKPGARQFLRSSIAYANRQG